MPKIRNLRRANRAGFSSKNPRIREILRILRIHIKAVEQGHEKAAHSTLGPFKASHRDAGLSSASFNFFKKC